MTEHEALKTISEIMNREAQERADRKLQHIIDRYGDGDGERRKPYYMEMLVREAIADLSLEYLV